ncbi:MAG: type II secretion system secretin GspD [Xanthomonadales bacterium]|nr:type II secretion system secretin GspD [Xanthomonadales bacterium]
MIPSRTSCRVAAAFALLAMLAGCATTPTQAPVQPPARDWNQPSRALSYVGGEDRVAAADPANDAGITLEEGSGDDDDAIREEIIQIGSRDLVNVQAASRPLPVPPTDGEVNFNFQDQPIQAVVQAIIGEVYGENYLIAPGVGGTVTYVTQKPIRAEQAMAVLEYLLALNNASIVFKEGRYEILPVTGAVPGNLSPRMGPIPAGRGYQVQIVPLTYISPSEMQRLLAPFARPNAVISADNSRGILVLAGTREELQAYLRTIEIFDVDWLKGMSIAFYPLENAEVAEVMPELEKLFMDPNGSPLAGMFRFLPVERLGGLFVITQNPDYLDEARRWLRRLDRNNASVAGTQLFVYDVRNIKAVDLADYLGAIFSGGGTPAGPSQRRAPRANVAPGLEATEIGSGGTVPAPAQTRRRQQAGGEGGIAVSGSDEISFTAVEENNQLLVRATSSQYQAVLAAIRKLDIEPLQVHVEMQIIEVSLTGDLQYGVQWFLEGLLGGNTNLQPGNKQQWAIGSGGANYDGEPFFYRFLNNELNVAIRALQSRSEVRILSAPSLTVLNNQEATINVGDQIPVVSQFLNPGSVGGVGAFNTNTVQFRDTGVILSVKPRVNPGGLVYLELSQEVSKPGEIEELTRNRAINRRTVETQVAVQGGESVLIGGLIDEENTGGRRGVPGLSNIPVVGKLFGSTSRREVRRELIVLIRPTVLRDVRDARGITEEYQRNFRQLKPLDLRTGQPLGVGTPAPEDSQVEPLPEH